MLAGEPRIDECIMWQAATFTFEGKLLHNPHLVIVPTPHEQRVWLQGLVAGP